MASRTRIIGVQHYDSDGGLDYHINGSQWLNWYRHEAKEKSQEEIKVMLLKKFEQAVDRALEMNSVKYP